VTVFARKPVRDLVADSEGAGLKRRLSATSLVTLGIGAIVGASILTAAGVSASTHAGPALVYSFILAAIGCALAGFCYSEFAAAIPIAGSAYSYAYATLGELPAWIVGWALILEYTVAAATVAVSWSAAVASILADFNFRIPRAPGAANLIAVVIVVAVSAILILGARESAQLNTAMVFIRVAVVVLFIVAGYFYIDKANYTPFVPPNATGEFGAFGWTGVLAATGQVFFAYIGFDVVSTAAQEAKNPKRDMPIGILGSLAICTVLYILYSIVLTGVVNYKDLNVAAPVALTVDRMIGAPWLGKLMTLGSVLGLTSVILVMLFGQSRVFYSMSRDGLLPKAFSDVHPKFHTPWRSNLMLMLFVSLLAAFTPITKLGDLISMGTLFAFVLVCLGVIVMRRTEPNLPRPFRTPWVPLLPILGMLVNFLMMLGLGSLAWTAFLAWMLIGVALYFSYSRFHSRLFAQNPGSRSARGENL
jgi:APA family basic amino acid/polyamine antiporter